MKTKIFLSLSTDSISMRLKIEDSKGYIGSKCDHGKKLSNLRHN